MQQQLTSFGPFCIQELSDIDLFETFDHGKTEGEEREAQAQNQACTVPKTSAGKKYTTQSRPSAIS